MRTVELSAGLIDYDEVGNGPTLVLAHGVPMSGSQWRKVVPLLSGYRCILPTLPMGGHRHPMRPEADISERGVAKLLGEFCAALDLEDVTLVLNDWGGGQFLLLEPEGRRIRRLVLAACQAFDNYPPAFAKPMVALARMPAGAWLFTRLMGLRGFRHAPFSYGGMAVSRIPDDVLDEWFSMLRQHREIRRDFARFVTSAPDRATLLAWSEQLRSYDNPVLVVWADQDRLMPREHGQQLAELYPNARLVEITGSGTLIPEDQPEVLATAVRAFLLETGAVPASSG